jgi:hypothetical protein
MLQFAQFSAICQVRSTMVPEKGDIISCGSLRKRQNGVALRRAIFKQKKGFAPIILGLISLVFSQPPSHDTSVRIRLRDPVLFYPLDPGSGIWIRDELFSGSRITDPAQFLMKFS